MLNIPIAHSFNQKTGFLVSFETLLFLIYIGVGPLICLLITISMMSGQHQMRLVKRPLRDLPDSPPLLTLLIPAKDEEERIAGCLRSALQQDYPNIEFIAIDDRSTDRTGAIMDQIAAEDPRLRVLHIPQGALPPGWAGKPHALHQAVPHARGDWLLFVDSDVMLEPDAARAVLSRALAHEYDLFSFLPRLETHTFWEKLIMPLAGAALSLMFLVSMANKDYLPRHGFATGQFLLIRRRVYDVIGGHEAVRGELGEDVAMARKVKAAGHKTRIALGTDFLSVRMYNSLSSLANGWARNYYAPSRGRPWRILAAMLFVLVSCMSVYPALGWGIYRAAGDPGTIGRWPWLAMAVLHWGVIALGVGSVYAWSGNRRWSGLMHPLGLAMMLWIFWRALKMCATRRVEWRGTVYQTQEAIAVSEM